MNDERIIIVGAAVLFLGKLKSPANSFLAESVFFKADGIVPALSINLNLNLLSQ